jgi:hypothetical protein
LQARQAAAAPALEEVAAPDRPWKFVLKQRKGNPKSLSVEK